MYAITTDRASEGVRPAGLNPGVMTPEQRDAVLELGLGRISPAEFVERTGLDPGVRPEIVESELRGALALQDADTGVTLPSPLVCVPS